MSRSHSIFRRVAKLIDNTMLCGDMLIVAPPRAMIKGYLLDATSMKNHVRFWRDALPLWRPMRGVVLN